MAKSSANFQKASEHSASHNLREDEPKYLLPKEHRLPNEIWQHPEPEIEIFKKSAAKQKTGRKPKFENSRWEAIINFNKNHSLGDLKKVAEHIEKKFNITCTNIAMHKDEGHLNERGVPIYNLHAHVNFITHKDGKQNWRKEFIKPADLRELQTEVAELLGMERGTDKRISKKERLEHRQFKQAKQEEATHLATHASLKKEISKLRGELQAKGAVRSDYAQLEQLAKELKERVKAKDLTIEEFKNRLSQQETATEAIQDDLTRAEVALDQKDAQIASQEQKIKELGKQTSLFEKMSSFMRELGLMERFQAWLDGGSHEPAVLEFDKNKVRQVVAYLSGLIIQGDGFEKKEEVREALKELDSLPNDLQLKLNELASLATEDFGMKEDLRIRKAVKLTEQISKKLESKNTKQPEQAYQNHRRAPRP